MKKIKYLSIAIIMALMLTGCGNKEEKVAEQYCDILIKENYGDMIDIAYFPNDKLLTNKKEEAKEQLAKKMKENKKTITSCKPMKSSEDDNKIYYKLTINENDSMNIEVDKKSNKVYIDNLYEERTITTYTSSKVSVDGIELSNPRIDDNKATYKFNAFKNVSYQYLATNDLLKDWKFESDRNYDEFIYEDCDTSNFKEEFVKGLDETIKPMFKDVIQVGFVDNNKSAISKYFINNDFELPTNKFKKSWQDSHKSYTFKNLKEDSLKYSIRDYISDNELKIEVSMDYEIDAKCIAGLLCTGGTDTKFIVLNATIKKDNNTWKISNLE